MIADAPVPQERKFTYKDVAADFQVHPKTVSRWFRRRKKLRVNHQTVRITQAQLDLFIKQTGKKPKAKK